MPRIFADTFNETSVAAHYQRKVFRRRGKYYLFWADRISSESKLFYRVADAIEDLGADTTITLEATGKDNSGFANGPNYDVHYDHTNDRVGIAWIKKDTGGRRLFFKFGTFNSDGTLAWSAETDVDGNLYREFDHPALGRAASGKWGVLATRKVTGEPRELAFYTCDSGTPESAANWTNRGNIHPGTVSGSAEYHRICQIGTTGDGLLLIYKTGEVLSSKRWDGAVINDQIQLAGSQVETNEISSPVVDSQGSVHITYLDAMEVHPFNHATYDALNDTWSKENIVNEAGDFARAPALHIDGSDHLHTFHRKHTETIDSICYFKRTRDGWQDETPTLEGDLAAEYANIGDTPTVSFFNPLEVIITWANEAETGAEVWIDTISIPIPNLQDITIKAPFWEATGDVVFTETDLTLDGQPQNHWAFRSLFVENTPSIDDLLLPGTIMALVSVKNIRIFPNGKDAQPVYDWNQPVENPIPSFQPSASEIKALLQSGDLTPFLLHAEPGAWAGGGVVPPDFTCLMGEVKLDKSGWQNGSRENLFNALDLKPDDTLDLTVRKGPERLLGEITAHASGISIYGRAFLPWEGEDEPGGENHRIAAPFQLARIIPDPKDESDDQQKPGFRLTIERNRLMGSERENLTAAWGRLSKFLNPRNPLNQLATSPATTNWITLEISDPFSVPRLFWRIHPWNPEINEANNLSLKFEKGEFNLLISDQQVYNTNPPPSTLARIIPDISIVADENTDNFRIELEANATVQTDSGAITYTANKVGETWDENFILQNLPLAFSPVEVPRTVRNDQNLPVPQWAAGENQPLSTPVLWGFAPLEDGWAQLPIINLTEQVYLDSRVAREEVLSQELPLPMIQGAASFGNDTPEVLEKNRQEQAWNIILTNAKSLQNSHFVLGPADDSSEFEVKAVNLEFEHPDVTVNGVFWLSSGRPTAQDALPDHDNWTAGLRPISLQSVKPNNDLFPSPVEIFITNLNFSVKNFNEDEVANGQVFANLKTWQIKYKAVNDTLEQLINASVLPEDLFSKHLPLIWRRHPLLPMIQALPLTQSQSPPSFPGASRQLIPFELGLENTSLSISGKTANIAVPSTEWTFGITSENAAAKWPVLLSQAAPSAEWKSLADLSLVALSMPGIVLDPSPGTNASGLPDRLMQLALQYRFDLPYMDELNALAQLPEAKPTDQIVSPFPDAPREEQAGPLNREDFAAHWKQLAERANLASADAVAAFIQQNGDIAIQHLIEPFLWMIAPPELQLDNYPGNLHIENKATPSAPLDLEAESGLKGISGDYVSESDGEIRRLDDGESSSHPIFEVDAGSMAAQGSDNGTFRDQRGLLRSATTAISDFIKTPVEIDGEDTPYELTSATKPLDLVVTLGDNNNSPDKTWQFWFRDLPVSGDIFNRDSVISDKADDINDPEALSSKRNYINGYEWRLADETAGAPGDETPKSFMNLYNLHFYPLTLENVVFKTVDVGGIPTYQIQQVDIIGRLQLPFKGSIELEDFSNAVQVTFSRDADNAPLLFSGISKISEIVEWPLALKGGETTSAPHLILDEIFLKDDRSAIELPPPVVKFFLFNEEWSITLENSVIISPNKTNPIIEPLDFGRFPPTAVIAPKMLDLFIDLESGDFQHTSSLLLGIQLGKKPRPPLGANVRFDLVSSATGDNSGSIQLEEIILFNDLFVVAGGFQDPEAEALFTDRALQLRWKSYQIVSNKNFQLLPGIHIHDAFTSGDTQSDAPGFATLTFDVVGKEDGIPEFTLLTSFVEILITCQWGNFLQTAFTTDSDDRSQIYGSSAGQITVG